MRAVVQRVSRAAVRVDGNVVGQIGAGLCVLLGVGRDDSEASARAMAAKLWRLRILPDAQGVMNVAPADVDAPLLVVSQFTLYGDTSRGRRPSWVEAAAPELAEPLIETVVSELRAAGATVETGRFRAHMEVELVNDGPVTLLLES